MIMRMWRGSTVKADADRYLDYLRQTGLHAYRETEGNLGALALRRSTDEGHTEFVTLSLWRGMEAVRAFASADPEVAVFYPEDERFLVDADPFVRHYEVADATWPEDRSLLRLDGV